MNKILGHLEEYLSAVCIAIMTLLTFVNIVVRYLGASFSFSEEVTTYLFVLLTLMGASIAAKRQANLGFTLISDMMPPAVHRLMQVVGYLFASIFCALLCYYGLLMTVNQFERRQITAGMQWPEWIFGAFVPFGAFFVTVRFVQLLVKAMKRKEA